MGDGASVECISRLLGKYLTVRDHTKLFLAAADGGDDTSEDDNGMWCYCQTAKDGSMNHVLYWLYVMPEDEKVSRTKALFQLLCFK